MLVYFVPIAQILIGLVALVAGGEWLVRGASRLAAAMNISPLVIGLTVVAFGTSAPELAVSLQSCFSGATALAVGNAVGSNICNVLLVLGLSAVVAPLFVSSQLIRWDVPWMIAASVSLLVAGWDGTISRLDGALMFGGLLVYLVWLIRMSRRESRALEAEYAKEIASPAGPPRTFGQLGLVFAGLVGLALGARWLVAGAVSIATMWHVSELVIGLTVVAIGTSLPEIVTSVIATLRGEREIVVGNVVGSNIFNVLCVLGLSGIVAPAGVVVPPAALAFDIPVMIVVAVACLPVFLTNRVIDRWEGAFFLFYYAAYTLYILLNATASSHAPTFSTVMIWYVIPITAVTLVASFIRDAKRREDSA